MEDNDQFLLSSQYISIKHVYTLLAAEQKLKSWDGGPVPHPNFLRPESYSSAANTLCVSSNQFDPCYLYIRVYTFESVFV